MSSYVFSEKIDYVIFFLYLRICNLVFYIK